MAASNPPVNGVAFIVYLSLEDMANPGSYKANPTLASGDVKVSIDGGAFANIDAGGGTLPAVTPAAGIAVKVTLSAAQMTGDNIFVQFIDQTNPKEWADYAFNIQTVAAIWLTPTTPGRTLDVSAGGEAGVDWGNVGSPTTANNLSGTNIKTDQVVASVTGAVGSVTGAVGSVTGNVGGNVVGTVASVVGNVGGNVVGSVGSVTGAVGSVTGNVGGNVNGNVVGSVASVTADVGITQGAADKVWLSAARTLTSFGTLVADIWASATRTLTSFGTLTADVSDKLLGRSLAGGADGGRTVQSALRILRNKRAIVAGTLTVYEEDDATAAWTASVATAATDPIQSIDP